MTDQRLRGPRLLGLSPNVLFLGITSFLTDISSEMIFTLLPLFLLNVLRVGTPVIGLIEGMAESTATLTQLLSGWLSDRLRRRKTLACLGYTISTLAKPVLYFASSWGLVLGVRFFDRLGKGVRTSPRDALLAASTPAEVRGKSFGFHRALDTFGAVVGLGGAAAIVFLLQQGELELARNTYQTLVLISLLPAVLAVGVIFFLVREVSPAGEPSSSSFTTSSPARFDRRFKLFLGIMVVFTLGNSSDAFLVLRAQNLGLSVFHILILFIFFNLVYASFSLPAGMLSDRLGRRRLIILGWLIYAASYLGFAFATDFWHVWLLFGLYGLFRGATEGVERAFVADLVGAEKRGTAYGLFHTAVGITILPASLIAGWLWQLISPSAPFLFGGILAGLAALLLAVLLR